LFGKSVDNRGIEIHYEEMVDDLEFAAKFAARKTLGFLEAHCDQNVLNFHEHARGKIVRSPTANALT
jgi:hypothetical protein